MLCGKTQRNDSIRSHTNMTSTAQRSPRYTIWHPIAFALQPVISQYALNAQIVSPLEIIRSAVILLSAALLLWLTLGAILRNKDKAALLVSLFLFAFFFWGHFVHKFVPPENFFYKTRYFAGYTAVFALIAICISFLKPIRQLNRFLNIVGGLLILFPLLSLATSTRDNLRGNVDDGTSTRAQWEETTTKEIARPDVFVFLLDGYSRADVLLRDYYFDNSPFLSGLEFRGFRVATNSHANYSKTLWSLGSALNGDYLDKLLPATLTSSKNLRPLLRLFHHNRVFEWFRRQGYTLYAFETGFELADMRDSADHFLAPHHIGNEFEALLIQLTPIPAIHQRLSGSNFFFDAHRERIHFVFDHIKQMAETPESAPRFVWTHVNMPHDPLVFGPAGEPRQYQERFVWGDAPPPQFSWQEYAAHATEQITYLNGLTLAAIDALLANTTNPPLIIVASDHGAHNLPHKRCEDSFKNLTAIYVPPSIACSVPDNIALVNLFPMVINALLQGKAALPLSTELRSYNVDWPTPYAPVPCIEGNEANVN